MEIRVQVEIPALDRLIELMKSTPVDLSSLIPHHAPEAVEVSQSAASDNVTNFTPKASEPESERSAQSTVRSDGYVEVPTEELPWKTTEATTNVAEKPKITLEQILKVTAEMRDDGKLPQLRSLMGLDGPYGVKMFSQLKPEQYEAFAEDLRKLGGKI